MSEHVVYGLVIPSAPRTVLYVGSIDADHTALRLLQHRRGECRTTRKMAERHGINRAALQMTVIRRWQTGHSVEGRAMHLCQLLGMARWNYPHALSSEDNRRGARIVGRANRDNRTGFCAPGFDHVGAGRLGVRNQPREAKVKGGRLTGRSNASRPGYMSAIGKLGGKINGPIQGRKQAESGYLASIAGQGGHVGCHIRWHVRRNLVNPNCDLCNPRHK